MEMGSGSAGEDDEGEAEGRIAQAGSVLRRAGFRLSSVFVS